ncbi:MAG: PEP-CTERM sorting domain-containing protein [Planctomycetia bacterium]|nr:PEP-CTERM sorting domain-containing protein [Planctomycetia bacterium]
MEIYPASTHFWKSARNCWLFACVLFCVGLPSLWANPVSLPYSTDFSSSDSNWTYTNLEVSNGVLKRTTTNTAATALASVDTGVSSMTTTVKIDLNNDVSINPSVLSCFTDSSTFYMYRVSDYQIPDGTQMYVFHGSGNSLLISHPDLNFTHSDTVYLRLSNAQVGDQMYLIGEASKTADFSTIFDRTKVATTHLLTGTSAGVRTQVPNSTCTFDDFSATKSYIWTNASGGDWGKTTNWSAGEAPNAAGAVVDFSAVSPSDPPTVSLSGTQTVGRIIFGAWTGSADWTLSGGTLNLQTDIEGGSASIYVESGSSVTFGSALSTTNGNNVVISGGGSVSIADASGLSGDLYVNDSTLKITASNAIGSSDDRGTIYLEDSAIRSEGSTQREVSNAVVVSGDCTFHSQGLTFSGAISGDADSIIRSTGGWQMQLRGDNSAYHGDWDIQADYLGIFSANSLGSGTIHYNGGGIIQNYANASIDNNIVLEKDILYFTGGGSEVTLNGTLSGTANVNLRSNQYRATTTTNLRGDAKGFSGNWTINNAVSKGDQAGSALIVSTDNASNVKVDGADSRFGSGTISLGNGVLQASAASTYIHSNINFLSSSGTNALSFDGKVLTLTGNLTGSVDIVIENTTAPSATSSRLRVLDGDNSKFSGDWRLTNTFLVTNAGTKDKAFGTGDIYLNGGSGLVAWASNSTASTRVFSGDAVVYNNIIVSGTNYFTSDGDTLDSQNVNRQMLLYGNISGDENALIIRTGGGYKWRIYGNNSQYQGDWYIQSDYLETNNTASTTENDAANHVDARFGSGTIYFATNCGIQGNNGSVVNNDLVINSGVIGCVRNGSFTFNGDVTVDGTFRNSHTTNFTHSFGGTLEGTGTLELTAKMLAGSHLAPGSVGTTNYLGEGATDSPVATLTFSRGLEFEPGAMIDLDFASLADYDSVVVSASAYSNEVDFSGVTVWLNFLDSFDATGLVQGDTFDLVSGIDMKDGVLPTLSYDFAALVDAYKGAQFSLISDGDALQLLATVDPAAVPEPATWVLLLVGACCFWWKARRFSPARG